MVGEPTGLERMVKPDRSPLPPGWMVSLSQGVFNRVCARFLSVPLKPKASEAGNAFSP